MNKLSKEPVVAEYLANMGQKVKLGNRIVTVRQYTVNGRQGSYERGLKFTSNDYGYLEWIPSGNKSWDRRYSPDHGKTWYDMFSLARKQRAGKVRLYSNTTKEFAFDQIQEINRRYEGPGYQWRP